VVPKVNPAATLLSKIPPPKAYNPLNQLKVQGDHIEPMICHYAKEKLTNEDIMVEQSALHSKGIGGGGGEKGGQDFDAAKDSIMHDSFFM